MNQFDRENKSEWKESASVYISSEQAALFRENPEGVTGKGEQDTAGLWRYKDENGTYIQNGWKEIGGKWYFFDQEGVMKTGWIQ